MPQRGALAALGFVIDLRPAEPEQRSHGGILFCVRHATILRRQFW